MNPPRALIAEDEPLLAEALRRELQAAWPELTVAATARDGIEAVAQSLALLPDVCFLDIRMPGQSGLEAARCLIEDWPAESGLPLPLVVFVTAYDDYALQAFEHAAADYLLKPVEPVRLAQACVRLQQRLAERAHAGDAPQALNAPGEAALQALRSLLAATGPNGAHASPPLTVIQASSGSTLHMVPIDEVLYFEAADKYVRVVTTQREHLIRTPLRELLPRLDGTHFWQVHRSTVVRATAIERVTRDETGRLTLHLRNHPDRLGVSRLYAHLFKAL